MTWMAGLCGRPTRGDMVMLFAFGEGGSPALHGDRLVVPWDHEEESFIVALEAMTGDEVWRQPRDEGSSWNTPLIVEDGARVQVVVNGIDRIRSYDLADGSLIWECGGMTRGAIPTPVRADGVVYVMSGFQGAALVAVDLNTPEGDVTNSDAVLWSKERDTPYVPSPALYDGALYYVKGNDGILSATDRATGESLYAPQRLDGIGNVYSSPVAAAGQVYISDREGATIVVAAGDEFLVLATNSLDDGFSAVPALSGDEIYLRGHRYLYCIANE